MDGPLFYGSHERFRWIGFEVLEFEHNGNIKNYFWSSREKVICQLRGAKGHENIRVP